MPTLGRGSGDVFKAHLPRFEIAPSAHLIQLLFRNITESLFYHGKIRNISTKTRLIVLLTIIHVVTQVLIIAGNKGGAD